MPCRCYIEKETKHPSSLLNTISEPGIWDQSFCKRCRRKTVQTPLTWLDQHEWRMLALFEDKHQRPIGRGPAMKADGFFFCTCHPANRYSRSIDVFEIWLKINGGTLKQWGVHFFSFPPVRRNLFRKDWFLLFERSSLLALYLLLWVF